MTEQPAKTLPSNKLATTLGNLSLDSLLLNASGTFNASQFNRMFSLKNTLGAVVTKTVTANPCVGNIKPRTHELLGIGMLNSIGLQNPGLLYCLETELQALAAIEMKAIVSISANSVEGFAEMVQTIIAHPHAGHVLAIELNLSCPNVEKGGVHFGRSTDAVHQTLKTISAFCKIPLIAKLTPNVDDIVAIGEAAVSGGATALTTINTVLGMAIDWKNKKAIMPRIAAGYSGPGIKPIALHAVWQLHAAMPWVPIVAVGGICTPQDVLEFVLAGASAVQVGTICFRNPYIFREMADWLHQYCLEEKISTLAMLRGKAHQKNT
ncbi:MAG: dihydroorotate dehydrogenase [Cyanobacteria bacterium P01_H01_bin.74]